MKKLKTKMIKAGGVLSSLIVSLGCYTTAYADDLPTFNGSTLGTGTTIDTSKLTLDSLLGLVVNVLVWICFGIGIVLVIWHGLHLLIAFKENDDQRIGPSIKGAIVGVLLVSFRLVLSLIGINI